MDKFIVEVGYYHLRVNEAEYNMLMKLYTKNLLKFKPEIIEIYEIGAE